MVLPKHSMRILTLCLLLCFFGAGCKIKPELAKKKYFRMDTITEVTLVVKDKKQIQQCWNSIDSLLKNWEDRFSVEGSLSEVRKLNERKKNIMPVSSQLRDMLRTAINYGDTLDGGFDLTILPIKQLWGLGENSTEKQPLPSAQQVQSALEKVDYTKVKIVNDSVYFSSEETQIDVGGIAKGYVLREIRNLLDRYGVENYLVSAGGDIIANGKRIDGKPWKVGIQHPRNQGILGSVELDSGSIVTSGDYERCRIIEGKRYHHLFDTRTGYCGQQNQSLTIYGPDPVEADIMSTGLFSRPAEQIIEFVNTRPRFECLVVDSCGKVFKSNGWFTRVTIFEEN